MRLEQNPDFKVFKEYMLYKFRNRGGIGDVDTREQFLYDAIREDMAREIFDFVNEQIESLTFTIKHSKV